MTTIAELQTPALVIDFARFERNCQRMQTHCDSQNVRLRPHVKTLRSLEAAHYYAPLGTPITVSTLAEAEAFAAAGYLDILYAVTITPNKYARVASLLANNVTLSVIVDSQAAADALERFAAHLPNQLNVLIELDVDGHRAGIHPQDADLISLAKSIEATPNLHFAGLMAHAGGSYGCYSRATQTTMAEQECYWADTARRRLKTVGINSEIVSIGSTPTALCDVDRSGITELRAGVYATFDCVMAGLGVCEFDDIAMFVQSTVIGQQPEKSWALIDAGWMALSRDAGTAEQPVDCGYGLVADEQGKLLTGWYVKATNQEHGVIAHRDGDKPLPPELNFGQTVRILPIHACATAAQFDTYWVLTENQPLTKWHRINGW